jgi:hypothetical protein
MRGTNSEIRLLRPTLESKIFYMNQELSERECGFTKRQHEPTWVSSANPAPWPVEMVVEACLSPI